MCGVCVRGEFVLTYWPMDQRNAAKYTSITTPVHPFTDTPVHRRVILPDTHIPTPAAFAVLASVDAVTSALASVDTVTSALVRGFVDVG